ncbi:hypothetical protein O0L34_g18921 [Tuta absoluta]|nr:hypothetical protein O0L34_g18921 [Tuta absoluta]
MAQAKYKVRLVSLEKCKIDPSREYKDPPLTYGFNARKVDRQTTLVQVNITVTEKAGPVFFAVRGYQVKQSASKDLVMNLERIPCTNLFISQLTKMLNIQLDKNCYSKPGNFTADNINIQDYAVILTKTVVGPGQ